MYIKKVGIENWNVFVLIEDECEKVWIIEGGVFC